MIKKILTMSAGIVLCSMITTASFATWKPSQDCRDARTNQGTIIADIQSCKTDGKWTCGPDARAFATVCKKACNAVREDVCPNGSFDDAAPDDVDFCDDCVVMIEM